MAIGEGNQSGSLEDADVQAGANRPRSYIRAQSPPLRTGHDGENALKEYRPPKLQAAIDAMDSLREEIVSLQRPAAIPKPHRHRLSTDQIR